MTNINFNKILFDALEKEKTKEEEKKMDDTISRAVAIDAIRGALIDGLSEGTAIEILEELQPAQHKTTREDVEEYCRRRNVVLITGELYKEMTKRWSRPEIIYCKDCINAEERGCALFCGFWSRYTAHKGYCFRSERRSE